MRTRSRRDGPFAKPGEPPEPVETRATLEAEHLALEARLAELRRHLTLTQAEQAEEQRLKKLKLAMKDRIARLPAS